ncbi:sulfite exporter TauE/SafE family protein [Pusillimonas sp. SM2304]|uniref:sulfite exporter TauE/SafE family protein n=1 Tax=Pusillimonas sp. SM2304 TaxID=3073241 RepID=UPI00287479E8|nr:sulfite exporter TauE/SafE family protein [Pusillimonas sp. SM2304]MDS1139975.1 sulfite exporter TauE/SafE family protein [Pusillimonas sp. SM2304]
MTIASLFAVILAGFLIGATGIGGVLLVPVLTGMGGVAATQAIAASSLAFGFPGVIALWFLHRDRKRLREALPVVMGTLPGAVLGALLVHRFDTRVVLALVTATIFFAGLRGLLGKRMAAEETTQAPVAAARLACMGMVVGIGSALTGTGGPVLLIPLLMLFHQPLRLAIVTGQAVQLPIALAAVAVHARAGSLDWVLGCTLGVILVLASLAGQWAAQRLRVGLLQSALSVFLLLIGFWFTYLLFL